MKTVAARRAAGRAGLPRPSAMTTTPYRRGFRGAPVWVVVVAARRRGHHVELETPEGKTFLVDLTHPIFPGHD